MKSMGKPGLRILKVKALKTLLHIIPGDEITLLYFLHHLLQMRQDYYLVLTNMIISDVLVLAGILISDILLAVADPRVRIK